MYSSLFGSVSSLLIGALLLAQTLGGASVSSRRSRAVSELDALFGDARAASERGDFGGALELYRMLERSDNRDYAWAATSALVATYRRMGDGSGARSVTARVAAEQPELAGLMAIWDGDTSMIERETGLALAHYAEALSRHGDEGVDGRAVGALALRQMARAHLAGGDAASAAAAERELLRRYPEHEGAEFTLASALLYDAMAAGSLPLKPLDVLLHDLDCSPEQPCLVSRGGLSRGELRGVELAALSGLRFDPSEEELSLLRSARPADRPPASAGAVSEATACTLTTASDGFQYPMANDHPGYVFMSAIGGGQYHPGLDINGPGTGDADCNTLFRSPARGCVTDSSPADWGSATVQHYYTSRTWTSQYGHARTVYYSVGAPVFKGDALGTVGKVGTGSCHLHHEIREQDHPAPTNANYYSSLSQSNVGDWYQDPFPFIAAHKGYRWIRWADESLFAFIGTWTTVTGVGDEDDLRWAYTTSTKTRYARYPFTTPSSGTYELWAFVPWNHATSTAARYRLYRSSTGANVFSKNINQNVLLDAWVKVGSGALTGGAAYVVEVATDTGESSRKVAVDDVLIIKIS